MTLNGENKSFIKSYKASSSSSSPANFQKENVLVIYKIAQNFFFLFFVSYFPDTQFDMHSKC